MMANSVDFPSFIELVDQHQLRLIALTGVRQQEEAESFEIRPIEDEIIPVPLALSSNPLLPLLVRVVPNVSGEMPVGSEPINPNRK